MKKIDLGRAIAVLANVGVLAGIVFLAAELRQNREMMRAQTRNELSQGIVTLLAMVADNGELADLRLRADRAEELTDVEAYRYSLFTRTLFRYWENVHYQYRLGVFDESEFRTQADAWARYLDGSRAATEFWCRYRREFSNEFVAEINGILDPEACLQHAGLDPR